MTLQDLPTVNACLNAASGALLIAGFWFIRHQNIRAHMTCMLSAVGTSVLFLAGYLTYHFQVGTTRFMGEGPWRAVYFSLLGTHTVLAMAIVPLVAITLVLALKGRFSRHRRIARWTLPLWLYVSATGVLVYFMLYHWFPFRTE